MFTPGIVSRRPASPVKPRRLIAVDLENVAGGAFQDRMTAAAAWRSVQDSVRPNERDLVVVGVSHRSAIAAWSVRPSARLVVRSGVDGADLALLDVLENEAVETRFEDVVVVSGDGIFADAVSRLCAYGVHVTVVARRDGLARRLRMAAESYQLIPEPRRIFGDAA